jgi:hypothetical protein
MSEGPTSSASIGSMLGLVIEVVVLLVVMGMVASEVSYMATLAHLQEAKLLASTVAGVITAVSAAPQAGLYCVSIPSSLGYEIVVGTEKIEGGGALELKDVPNLTWCPVADLTYLQASDVPYFQEFRAAADKYNVPLPALLAIGQAGTGMKHTDSSGRVIRNGQAVGIMQVIDGPENLQENIEKGAEVFRSSLEYFKGDLQGAFAGYSGGIPGASEQIQFTGPEAWITNIETFGKVKTSFYNDEKKYGSCACLSMNEYFSRAPPEGLGKTLPDGSSYTVEKQNACAVKKGTEYTRFFESLGIGYQKYGFVAAIKREDKTGGVAYMPVSSVESQVLKIPAGQKYTILAKKTLIPRPSGGYDERIVLRMRKGGLAQAGCTEDVPSICLY